MDRTRILERPLSEARGRYDFVLLDTSPSAAAMTTVAGAINPCRKQGLSSEADGTRTRIHRIDIG